MKRGVDYIGIGAIIVDKQGLLFLARRGSKAKNKRGLCEFPGGSVEFGETLAQAFRREIQEEYGVVIEAGELVDVVDHILPQEQQHWASPTYFCRIVSGVAHIREPEKYTEIGRFDAASMPDGLTQITQENFEHYHGLNAAG